jgi:hypothetical protein
MFSTVGISGVPFPIEPAALRATNPQADVPEQNDSMSPSAGVQDDQLDGFVGVLCGGLLGVPIGEAIGSVIGAACAGPLGAVVGRSIGAVVGEIGGSLGGGFADEWASRRFSGELA